VQLACGGASLLTATRAATRTLKVSCGSSSSIQVTLHDGRGQTVHHRFHGDAVTIGRQAIDMVMDETAFREELSAPEFKETVIIHYDQGDPSRSLDLRPILAERKNREHLYCCGPRPLMETVRAMTDHWSPTAVHFEAFSDAETHKAGDTSFKVKLARSGNVLDVPTTKTILEVLRDHGLDVPSSCETGTCGTCRTKMLAGEADHRDLVLADHERKDTIMICVSRARGGEITIDR